MCVGLSNRRARRWREFSKAIGNTQKRLACFCCISCFAEEREEASVRLDFLVLCIKDKSTDNILCGNIDLIEGDKQLK